MDMETLQKFISIILKKQLFTDVDMESFGDEGANVISRAKLHALINVVMKDASDEEKQAYRDDVAKIYETNIRLKIENTLKMFSDIDVLKAMGIEDSEQAETLEEIKKHLLIPTDIMDSSIKAVTNTFKNMKL